MDKTETVENILRVEGVKAKGFGIIPKLAMQDTRLTIEAKAIYSYFCSFTGAGNTAFPSLKKILEDLQIGKKRYYKHFRLLKDFGYIKTEQHNENGQFKVNIYTLVENPTIQVSIDLNENSEFEKKESELDFNEECEMFLEIEHKIPLGQNDTTVPMGHFDPIPLGQNDTTKNNSIKNNKNIYINSQSVNHNIYNIYNSNEDIKKIEGMNDEKVKELESIYQKSEVELFNENEKAFIKKIIADLFCSESQKVRDRILDSEDIRIKLHKLTLNTLDYALNKFKESKNFTKVHSPEKYFRVILLNSIDEVEMEKIRTG